MWLSRGDVSVQWTWYLPPEGTTLCKCTVAEIGWKMFQGIIQWVAAFLIFMVCWEVARLLLADGYAYGTDCYDKQTHGIAVGHENRCSTKTVCCPVLLYRRPFAQRTVSAVIHTLLHCCQEGAEMAVSERASEHDSSEGEGLDDEQYQWLQEQLAHIGECGLS